MTGAHILIVEDEGVVAMELASFVEEMGYVVAAIIDNGEAARQIASTTKIDLALVDVRLKGAMSGIDVARVLHEVNKIPVIFLTAYTDDETLEQIKRCEPRGYLLKPFDQRTLWVTVETALYAHKMSLERASAEQARRRSEAQRLAILEHCPDAIISVNASQIIIGWNEGAERIFGYDAAEILNRPLSTLLPPGKAEQHTAMFAHFLATDRYTRQMGASGAIQGRRKDGVLFPADVSISKLELDGQVILTAFVRDVTHRKLMERQLEQAARLEALGRLAGGVAHDFNNMLVGVFGYARLLKQSFTADDPRIGDVEEIERAAERASSLVHELLAYGRQQVLRPELTDVNSLLLRLEPLLRVTLGRSVHMKLELAPMLPRVLIDQLKLDQVVVNLVLNARDAVAGGGSVTVSTSLADANGQPSGARGAKYVVVSVSDTGVGMDEPTQARIFEPFFTTKAATGGTGLGLATVHGIVTQSGGNVRVRSRVAEGTRFDLVFPAVAAASTALDAGQKPDGPAKLDAPCVVLLVDDEHIIRELGARVLENAGLSVIIAADGDEALRVLGNTGQHIDLLLTDVVMPSVSGYEVADFAKKHRPEMRVAIMTGYNRETLSRMGSAALDAYAVIEKPFAPDVLVRRVCELVGRSCEGAVSRTSTAH